MKAPASSEAGARPAAPAGPAAGRRRVFIALTILGASCVLLLAAEAALRVREKLLLHSAAPSSWAGDYLAYQRVSHAADRMFVRDPGDPVVPYRNRPGFALDLPLPSGMLWSCRLNSLGFRGPEFTPRKPPSTFRILCLGGSTTFWGYSDWTTYPSLLEAMLTAALPQGPRVEVLNLGVSGYTSGMSAERFRREYLAFSPDLVVVYHGINDIQSLAPRRYRHRLASSLLAATLQNIAWGWVEGGEGTSLAPEVAAHFDAEIAPHYDSLLQGAEAAGARLLVLTFPGPVIERLTAEERRYMESELYRSWRELGSLPAHRAALLAYNGKLRSWAERSGTALVDLAERVQGAADIYMDLCHMNTRGLERIAAEVSAEILRRAWVKT